jgi:hypothetical protein
MRFMMMIKASKDPVPGKLPPKEAFEEMSKFNEQIAKAGILLDMGGLQSSSKGARIKFSAGGKKTVVDGPFTESKELVLGYWIVQVKSLEEAVEWAKRAPVQQGPDECEIEVRQFFEIEDFPETDRVKAAKDAGKKAGDVYMEMAKEAREGKK